MAASVIRWRSLFLMALVAVALAASVAASEACSCGQSRLPCEAVLDVKAVFVATVVSIDQTQPPAAAVLFDARRVQVRVTEAFTGAVPGMITVRTGRGGGDCGYEFAVGESYVIYAYGTEDGLGTGICTRTRKLAEAPEDLLFLRAFIRMPSIGSGRLVGEATRFDPDNSGQAHTQPLPESGLRLFFDDGTRTIDARTDWNGRFDIRAPAGKYRVRADAPPGRYVMMWPETIELRDARGCASLTVQVRSDAHVSGVVVNTRGEPVPYVPLALGSSTKIGQPYWSAIEGRTDADGRFDIGKVPPGEFVLAVNRERSGHGVLDPAVPVYWPGTTDVARARVIELSAGQRFMTEDFVLPDSLVFSTLAGVVVTPEGTPAAGARVYLKPDRDAFELIGPAVETDVSGRFALAVVVGRRYRLTVEFAVVVEGNRRLLKREIEGFLQNVGAAPITIRLEPSR